jgi:2-oxoglutarate dehydrogenase E1 component
MASEWKGPDLGSLSSGFSEAQYARYLADPNSVDGGWRGYFETLEAGAAKAANGLSPSWARSDWPPAPSDDLALDLPPDTAPLEPVPKPVKEVSADSIRAATLDSLRALMMIRTYRVRGHLIARLDPLGLEERPPHPELEPETYGFGKGDLDRPIFIDHVLGLEMASIREILEILHRTYCTHVGIEFMHINDPDQKAWIQLRIEGREKEIQFDNEGKKEILEKLVEAEQFENFLGRKYVGTKRFGLDGSETTIPALESIIRTAVRAGADEIVLGMSHRGRLNVLANVLKKPFSAIFHEFHGGSSKPDDVQGSGDVKYHLGTSSDRQIEGRSVHLSLTANPSHLEAVDPVVLGKVRAKQMQKSDRDRTRVLSLLLHGDAAFAGQGLVAECFMLSNLPGYRTGGTIHLIINNQIGFTTSPHHSRSSPYPSDAAKMVQAPIFHVNGDDPEAVIFVTRLATKFRQTFRRDVVVDLICYRRFGHNEGDEPAFTQPLMYANIRKHATVAGIYKDRLIREGVISDDDYNSKVGDFRKHMEAEFDAAGSYKPEKADWFEGSWEGFGLASGTEWRAQTGVSEDALREIGRCLTRLPDGFHLHRTLNRVLDAREQMFETGQNFDWATAEALAFGSLLIEGFPIRLSGQDSRRGTFSQRHADFVDQQTEARYCPLQNLGAEGHFEVFDSPLSETGVLGFEYGYSSAEPRALVLWEAQFGDFANGAQVIIDQFISTAEAKWLRMSGLVMLLPHGYEGQGPEHSSARLERYLQLCAEDNMQVANCTTPASYFHLLRRQLHRDFRKPLIVMTPKSLLRHKLAISELKEMGPGTQFHRLLWDDAQTTPGRSIKIKSDDKIERVILCSGKVYYDLFEERARRKQDDTYILRLEQLYPFPKQPLLEELGRFRNIKSIVWSQEEPKNMGAWFFVEPQAEEVLADLKLAPRRLLYAGRQESASTATGLATSHLKQQAELVDQALSAN